MLFSLSLLIATSAASLVGAASQVSFSSESNISGRSEKPVTVYSHLQVTRRQLQDMPSQTSSKTKRDHIHATPTSAHLEEKDTRSHKRSGSHRQRKTRSMFFIKIHKELMDCLRGIREHTSKIRDIEGLRVDPSNAEQVAWGFLEELRAILTLLRDCHRRIRNCDGATSPSGVPGGGSSGARCPSLAEICQLISQIVRELKTCFALLTRLSSRFPIIQQICGETLENISEALSVIVNVTEGQLGNVRGGLGQIFRSAPGFFVNLGFGFSASTLGLF